MLLELAEHILYIFPSVSIVAFEEVNFWWDKAQIKLKYTKISIRTTPSDFQKLSSKSRKVVDIVIIYLKKEKG